MIVEDDRTTEQRKTHVWGVTGRDSFMSGWGQAQGGYSRCAWAVPTEFVSNGLLDRLERWVRSRGDMKYVNVVRLDRYRPPRGTKHWHVYVVNVDHPGVR